MDCNSQNSLGFRLKNIFSLRRTKVTLYMAAVLWVAVVTQAIVNQAFQEEIQITEAFIKSETQEMQSTLEIIAEYNSEVLKEKDIKNLIFELANSIGLKVDDEITVWEEDGKREYFFFKQAKQATTKIKIVSIAPDEGKTINGKNYIIVQLSILKGIQSIDRYKKSLEDKLAKLGVVNKQLTLKYEGCRDGDLTSVQKHEMAALLVDELQGEIALEYDEGDLYTVYAYTGMLNEYVTSLGNKINIQIVITYNELTNKSKIEMATPMLNDSW